MSREHQDPAAEGAKGAKKGAKDDSAPESADAPASGAAPLDDAAVAAYLRANPDFLARHESLLDVLHAPGRRHGEGVVDLQQFMTERLRGEVARLRDSRDDLVQTSRANMNTQSRVHEAVLALLSAHSFEHLIETVTTDLAVILDVDAATICVEQVHEDSGRPNIRGVRPLAPGSVDSLLGQGHSHRFVPEVGDSEVLFGEAATLVRSAALLRVEVSAGTPPALLAMGSREPGQFEPAQGSELLRFMAGCLAATIRRWLDLPTGA